MNALVIVFVQFCSAAYKEAGGVASEALSGIRTVTALSGQEKEISRYSKLLVGLAYSLYRRSRFPVLTSQLALIQEVAKRFGIKSGFVTGFSGGLAASTFYVSYTVCLWFGAWLVRHGIINSW